MRKNINRLVEAVMFSIAVPVGLNSLAGESVQLGPGIPWSAHLHHPLLNIELS
jgi:hypothetical protein